MDATTSITLTYVAGIPITIGALLDKFAGADAVAAGVFWPLFWLGYIGHWIAGLF